MRFAWFLAAIAVACVSAPLGCGGADESGFASGSSAGGQGGMAEAPSISLGTDGSIRLAPGATIEIHATVKPAERGRQIAFALLGDPADASLDASVVATDGDGTASTHLHAPSVASTFLLRATLIGDSAAVDTVSVSVSRKGFATIDALPQYAGGRDVTTWTATAITRTSCAALAPTLPDLPPGGLETTASLKGKLAIHDVPVGPPVALVVRAGHFAWGCVDSPSLLPNATSMLGVTITDKPLDLAATKLDFSLAFAPDPTDLGTLAADGLEVIEAAVFGQNGDAALLLDGMQAAAAPPSVFANARNEYGWDGLVGDYLTMNGVNLRADVEAWAYSGLGVQPPLLAVRVTGSATAAQSQSAKLTIVSLGSFTPIDAGLTKTDPAASWSADSNDVVTLSGKVAWAPSTLVASSALVGAKAAQPGVDSIGAALASDVDCQALANALGGYEQCDAECLDHLCVSALALAWKPAAMASANRPGALQITINGKAMVNDVAAPSAVDGQWIGVLGDAEFEANIKGAATATKTGSHTPP